MVASKDHEGAASLRPYGIHLTLIANWNQQWHDEIGSALARCDGFVILLSSPAPRSLQLVPPMLPRAFLFLAVALLMFGLRPAAGAASTVSIAAASDLVFCLAALNAEFSQSEPDVTLKLSTWPCAWV